MDKARTRNLVLFALARPYKKELILVGIFALLKSISIAVSPLILYAFVWYSHLEHRELYIGLSLVGCLLIVKLIESLSQRHWFFDSRRCGMRMRSAVMAALYLKELKISSQGRKRHSAGEIVNYIAVDAYRQGEFPWWFHMAWSLPLQLLFSVAILFGTVGLGALPGLVPLVVFGFLNLPAAKMLQHFQSEFMVAQDERLRATSEVPGDKGFWSSSLLDITHSCFRCDFCRDCSHEKCSSECRHHFHSFSNIESYGRASTDAA